MEKDYNLDAGVSNYQLLSPKIAWLGVNEFVEEQQHLTISYKDMKSSVNFVLQNTQGHYAFYFEDLTTGAWIGIHEKEEFASLSLLKVPTMIATLKEVESGNVSLDTELELNAEDIDMNSGTLGTKGAGYKITVRQLLVELIKHSDNTALLTLNRRVVSEQTFVEARLAMGMPPPTVEAKITAKDYANMLRGLYFSNYLRRPFSELALTLMLDTDFNSQIPAGVPKDVKVAHKVGFYTIGGYYHDCGIIYAPNKPYILCVLSKDSTQQEADKVISQLSKIVYVYVTTHPSNINSTNNP